MTLYSFIIPHKNAPKLLDRCLHSIPIRNDVEIIVVDDCSDTALKPQIKREDVQTVYLSKEESKGAGHARNIGISLVKGKWLLFADCDDFYENNFLDVLDKFVDSDYDIIFFDSYVRFNTAKDKSEESGYSKFYKELERSQSKCSFANLKHCLNAPWNKVYRRDFIEKNRLQFEEIPIGNDAYFVNMASLLAGNVYFLPQKLYYYVDNPGGITRKKARPIKDMKALFRSVAKVDTIKYKSGALDTIYPFTFSNFKKYIRNYGIANTIKLYWIKFSFPHYPLFKIYKRKFTH